MLRTSKTFRVFVSSTFTDLKLERDALQAEVFPRLQNLCAQYGAAFQAIDLRWGISQEASRDQQTMNICLDEIRRCQSVTPRPNFLILLGDRYGWQPAPPQIPADEYQLLIGYAPQDHQELIDTWYRRDDNAVPADYCLQPWSCSHEEWAAIEERLHAALLSAARAANLPAESLEKYWASATHQEINAGALKIKDAEEHVHFFLRSIGDLPHDRRAEGFIDLDHDGHPDGQAREYQQDLKDELRKHIPENVHEYRAVWQGSGPTTEHIGALCDDVYSALEDIIMRQVGEAESPVPWKLEQQEHEAFAGERARTFIGREQHLHRIGQYLADPEASRPLVLWGTSGSGKTALLARAIKETRHRSNGACIVHRFVGLTPDSSDPRSLLESLCDQIGQEYNLDEAPAAGSLGELISQFSERLKLASAQQPLILVLDALDQQSRADSDLHLQWIPTELPEHVRVIVSTTPGEVLGNLRGRLPETRFIELGGLSPIEYESLLDLWLQGAHRTLRDRQRQELTSKVEGCPLPLYLKLGFEEACRWKSYTPEAEATLSEDVQGVIRDLFHRLSLPSQHGELLVARSLAYLAAAKDGLAEHELLDVLALDDDVYEWFLENLVHTPPDLIRESRAYLNQESGEPVSSLEAEDWIRTVLDSGGAKKLRKLLGGNRASHPALRLPVVLWSRLYADLEPYLNSRTVDGTRVVGFYHRQIGEVAEQAFLSEGQAVDRHRHLSRYFSDQDLYLGEKGNKVPNLRKLSEQPYQQTLGRSAGALVATLSDYPFLMAKTRASGIHHAIEDYRRAIRSGVFQDEESPEGDFAGLDAIMKTLVVSSDVIQRHPAELPTQLLGRLERTHVSPIVRHLLEDAIKKAEQAWLRSTKPALISPFGSVLRSFYIHQEAVMDVAVLPDGGRFVSGSLDHLLRVIDLENGLELHCLEGHTKGVQRIAVTPDGKNVVSASWDHTLKVWDLQTGRAIKTLKGHEERVLAVAVSPDGRRIVSGDWLGKVRLWNLSDGKELACYDIHDGPIWDLAVSRQGDRCVSGSEDRTVRIWEMDTGRILHILQGHADKVFAVDFTRDGQRVVSGAWDGSIRIWDLPSGQLVRKLNGNDGNVWCVALSANEIQVMGGLSNGLIKIWDMETGELVRSLEGHSNWVSAIALVPDRNQLISGSFDHGVIIWDLDREILVEGKPIAEPVDHGVIWGVGVALDGKHAYATYYDGTLAEWSLETGEKLREKAKYYLQKGGTRLDATGQVMVQVFNNTRRSLTASSLDGVEKGGHLFTLPPYRPRQDRITAFAISRDRRRFAFGSEKGNLEILDLSHKKQGSSRPFRALLTGKKHEGRVNSIAITPDGRRALSGAADHMLKVWDLDTAGKQLASLEGHRAGVQSVAVSPDGRWAVSSSMAGGIKVWDLESYEERLEFDAGGAPVFTVLVSPDARYVFSAGEDKTLRIWGIESGAQVAAFSEGGVLHNLAISPDGETLVAGGDSRKLHILKIAGIDLGAPIVTSDRGIVQCPHCGKSFETSDDPSGITFPCPECSGAMVLNRFTVTTLAPADVVIEKKAEGTRKKPKGTPFGNPREPKKMTEADIEEYLRKRGQK